MIRHPPVSPLFPYTPLFRSVDAVLLEPSCVVARAVLDRFGNRVPPVICLSIYPPEARLGRIDAEADRSEEHTSELQSRPHLVCRLLLGKKKIATPYESGYIN